MSLYEPEVGTRRERRALPRNGVAMDDDVSRYLTGENLDEGELLFVEVWDGHRWVKIEATSPCGESERAANVIWPSLVTTS